MTKRFSGTTVVDSISLCVNHGEFLTLLGPSGCGKTTTLRMLAGFVRPDEGAISAGGRLLSSSEHAIPPERRRMGMVFQDYAVWPHKSVFQNVAFGLQMKKVPRREIVERVTHILGLVDLGGMADRRPEQLSGGQLQRVALARALVVEPDILLLDEPLSNLDAKLRERMRDEIKNLQRRTQITFIYVTHDQAEAMALADRVVVMEAGRIQQVGTPREVYSHPRNRMVAEFMGKVNLVTASVVSAGYEIEVVAPSGLQATVTGADGCRNGEPVLLAIRPEDIVLYPPLERSPSTHSCVGRISDAVYLGNTVSYEVVMADDTTLHVETPPSRSRDLGDVVEVEVKRAAVIDPSLDGPVS